MAKHAFRTAFKESCLFPVAVCQCFRCDSIRCIPREAICDGASDCSDGTDEIDCSNSGEYTSNLRYSTIKITFHRLRV